MFIKWKKRYSKRTGNPIFDAVLAQSKRVKGIPKSISVAHLASYHEDFKKDLYHQNMFWKKVTAKLDELALSDNLRASVEDTIKKKVDRPSVSDIKAYTKISNKKALIKILDPLNFDPAKDRMKIFYEDTATLNRLSVRQIKRQVKRSKDASDRVIQAWKDKRISAAHVDHLCRLPKYTQDRLIEEASRETAEDTGFRVEVILERRAKIRAEKDE